MYYTNISQNWDIKVSWERYDSCFWEISEPAWQWIFSISFIVVVRTMRFFTRLSMQALFNFKIVWMELLFLPTMTILTSVLKLASIFIRGNKSFCMPILTHIFGVVKNGGLPSIILPVMCVNTDISFMIVFSVWAPYCFEMKKIEIHIRFKFFNQFNRKFIFGMSKGAKFTILAFLQILQVRRTEFGFILVWVVEFFNSVVCFITVVTIGAFLMVFNIPALFWLVKSKSSSSIFLIVVIVWAFFKIVPLRVNSASYCLEQVKIQERNTLVHFNILCSIVAILPFYHIW